MNTYAPIALFTYNRFKHLKIVLKGIKNNPLAKKSTIYIFSDFTKDLLEVDNIKKIRKYLKNLKGFKKVIIVEREYNFGSPFHR